MFYVTSCTRELHTVFYKVEYGSVVFEFRLGREVLSPPRVESLLASVCPFIAIKCSVFSERARLSRKFFEISGRSVNPVNGAC